MPRTVGKFSPTLDQYQYFKILEKLSSGKVFTLTIIEAIDIADAATRAMAFLPNAVGVVVATEEDIDFVRDQDGGCVYNIIGNIEPNSD